MAAHPDPLLVDAGSRYLGSMSPSTPPPSAPSPTSSSASGAPPVDATTSALSSVKTAFPPDASTLFDLQLGTVDDTTAMITILLNPQPKIPSDDVLAIVDAIVAEFTQQSIAQPPCVSCDTGGLPADSSAPADPPAPSPAT
jgi:hypothetical protein